MILIRQFAAPLVLVALATSACGQKSAGAPQGVQSYTPSAPGAAPVGQAYAPAAVPRGGGQQGGIARDQFMQRGRARMMRLDTDHDGKISLQEFSARPAGRGGEEGRDTRKPRDPSRRFNRFDTNHDGFLDSREIDAMLALQFQRHDANGDGTITPDERHARRAAAPRP